jgi:hypothetical protein
VDDTPVRVLRNLTAAVPGYRFPSKPAMLIRGSIWDGSSLGDGRRPGQGGLVQGALHRGLPRLQRRRGLRGRRRDAAVLRRPGGSVVERPRVRGPLRRAAGGVRGRQEQQHGLRLLHGRAPVQQPCAARVQLQLRLQLDRIISQLTCEQ